MIAATSAFDLLAKPACRNFSLSRGVRGPINAVKLPSNEAIIGGSPVMVDQEETGSQLPFFHPPCKVIDVHGRCFVQVDAEMPDDGEDRRYRFAGGA